MAELFQTSRTNIVEHISHVYAEGENAKISVRNIRRDAISGVKDLLKEKTISEDEARRAEPQRAQGALTSSAFRSSRMLPGSVGGPAGRSFAAHPIPG